MTEHAAAPAPSPAPHATEDEAERNRILGGGEQGSVSASSSSAPTLEEIQATFAAAGVSTSTPLAPPSDTDYESQVV